MTDMKHPLALSEADLEQVVGGTAYMVGHVSPEEIALMHTGQTPPALATVGMPPGVPIEVKDGHIVIAPSGGSSTSTESNFGYSLQSSTAPQRPPAGEPLPIPLQLPASVPPPPKP